MAKDQTGKDDRASSPKTQRKPLTIDLAAAEVARKSADAKPDSDVAAPGTASSEGISPVDPIIPSALAGKGSASDASHADAKAAPPRPARNAERRWRSAARLFFAALAGGAVAAAIVVAIALAGYFPPFASESAAPGLAAELAALKSEVAALEGQADAISPMKDQISKLQDSLAALLNRPAPAQLDPSMLKDVQDRLTALENAAASPANTAPADLEPRIAALAQAVAALKSASPADTTALQSNLADLQQQVDGLAATVAKLPAENRVAALEAKVDDSARRIESATALAPAVAADALEAALDSGRPFQSELAALKTLGVDAGSVDALEPWAAAGLPAIASLREEFENAVGSVALATPIPENTGAIDRLLRSAEGLVQVRPAHPTEGTEPPEIVARIRGFLAAGDLKSALAAWNTLPDAVKASTGEWAKKAEARLAAEELVTEVRTAALSKLAAGE